MGAKGLVLEKVSLCVRSAMAYPRSSLAWWEASSWVKRGFLRNGLLSGYTDRIDLMRYMMSSLASPVIPLIVDYTDMDTAKGYTWRKILLASIPTSKGRAIPVGPGPVPAP